MASALAGTLIILSIGILMAHAMDALRWRSWSKRVVRPMSKGPSSSATPACDMNWHRDRRRYAAWI